MKELNKAERDGLRRSLNGITKRVSELVKEAGGVTAFSRRLGVTRQCVHLWINGDTYPDAGNLTLMGRVLDVDLNWLLVG